MKKLRALIHFIMLLMTPGLFAYPHHHLPQKIKQWPRPTTYKDGIEIYSQTGRGAYFKQDGSFRGFIEYGNK